MTVMTTKEITSSLERRALQVQRGGARAAVLGVNDGLVSVLCIVIGVAAAGTDAKHVLLAGFAGLIAGAISMAAGEWISVKAQVELFEGVLADVKQAVRDNREVLTKDLAKSLEKSGIDAKTALHAAKDVARSDDKLTTMYSAEVIGINDEELGSPWVAAWSSFALFTAGAIAPLAPWVLGMEGLAGIMVAVLLTSVGALFVGGYAANSSGKNIGFGAVRQLLIVIFAALVTYGIGHIFGVATS